ncbi:helix-turn-helix transcriptional regulator [Streptomyces sp. DSM 42041]|uniref:Helix-turn-helix transcriptional regulator n=1 Tax=Streptomyces hazeniae TaxID=3075538 RepID=A0ABU2NXT1_9ACTN|nr:helix-turn-helix transcriptional regulator [Streptomyces sp. DSM 42041]MDT0380777.1 helix-turn-helix transcriptional regulator [Streptomyces sp. DSM 42041]
MRQNRPYRPVGSFDAVAARRLRQALGMTPAHVAHGMWAAFGLRVPPHTVLAWEEGDGVPGETELPALAGALWCAPGDLLGEPQTLRQHRMAAGMAVPDLALLIGVDPAVYERMEQAGHWDGDDRQAAALARALRLPPDAALDLTGRSAHLAELLRSAVTTRWQSYAGRVADLVPLERSRLEDALRDLHRAYQSATAGSLHWGGAGSGRPDDSATLSADFLDGILERFWERAGVTGTDRR